MNQDEWEQRHIEAGQMLTEHIFGVTMTDTHFPRLFTNEEAALAYSKHAAETRSLVAANVSSRERRHGVKAHYVPLGKRWPQVWLSELYVWNDWQSKEEL